MGLDLNIPINGRTGILMLVLLFVFSCSKENPSNGDVSTLDRPIHPDHFPPPHYNFESNPYSKEGFELGRKLFFDPILSVDGTISCGSCHHQKDAFADSGNAVSAGVFGRTTKRNSQAIINMAWNTSFMWDGGINHIEVQPFSPIINPNEMGEDLGNAITKLRNHAEYPDLFENVFDKFPLDDQQLFRVLAQYMGNLVSAGSKYDQYLLGEIELSAIESQGLAVFRTHCAGCHTEPLLTDHSFHNNGLDSHFDDAGRYIITQNAEDMGTFKTPTLRNIMLTGPYMHDGRFEEIEDVIDHYANGIKDSPTLSHIFQNSVDGIGIDEEEKLALRAFLETLTDYDFVSNPELSEE